MKMPEHSIARQYSKHTCWMWGANFSRAWEYGKIAWVWTNVSVIEIIKKHKELFNRTNGKVLTRAGYPRNETFHTLNSPKSTWPVENWTCHLAFVKETSLLPYRCIIPKKGRIHVVNHYSLSINYSSFQTMKSNSNFGSNKLFIKQGQGSTE